MNPMKPSATHTLELTRQIAIDASVDAVWREASPFDGVGRWLPGVASVTLSKGRNDVPGTVRHIELAGGAGWMDEDLLEFDAAAHRFRYRMFAAKGLPIGDYVGDFHVAKAGVGRSMVTYTGRFTRLDRSARPAPGADDQAAIDAALANLKKRVEST